MGGRRKERRTEPPHRPHKGTHAHHRHGHHRRERPWEQPPVTMEGAGHQAARLQAGQGRPEGPLDTPSPVPQPLLRTGLSPGQARPPSGVQPSKVHFSGADSPTPVNPAGLGGFPPPTPQVPSSGPRGGGLPPSCPRTCRSQPSRGPARRQRVSPEWSPHPPASPGGHRREGAGALPRMTGLHLPEWGCGPSRRPPVLGRRTPGQSSGRPGRGQGRRHPESRSRHGLVAPPATGRPGPVGTLAPRPR